MRTPAPGSTAQQALEGVVRFQAHHRVTPLQPAELQGVARPLLAWRQTLLAVALVGRDPARYGGAGFGNLSARLAAQGRARPFLITGTQTGGLAQLDERQLCVVERYDLRANQVHSHGPLAPSSESMTHGVLYDHARSIRFVFHGHAPTLWRAAERLRLPTTHPSAGYGTPEMALEVRRLLRQQPAARLIIMGGHEDGIIAFGQSAFEAGQTLRRGLRWVRR